MLHIINPHTCTLNKFLHIIFRKVAFSGKIIKILIIISKQKDVEKFQIRCQHLYAKGYHAYRFGDSNINSVGEVEGYCWQMDDRTDRDTFRQRDTQTDRHREAEGRTDRWTDDER